MSTTLPLFWHLSSASKKERVDASVKLIGALEQFQTQFAQKPVPTSPEQSEDEDEEEDEEDEGASKSKDGLEQLNAQDVSYSIRRLVRGLASPRESSRLGFAVALTELLSRIDTVTCSQILGLIIEGTKHQGSMNGQEERDTLFARLFGIMSVIQSGLAVRTKPLATSGSSATSASSLDSFEQIITSLVELGEQKSWLRESAWFAISLSVDSLHESDVFWKDEATAKMLDALFVQNTVWSTEKVALALKLQVLYPKSDWKTLLSPVFKNTDLLSVGNLATVSRILKESATDEDGAKDPSKAPSSGWKPQLNFSWDIILEQILPGPNSKNAARGSFQDFYRVVVDESLFSSTSSANRKYWGFQVFQRALKMVDQESMPMLFTKNFMRTWINHLSKKDRYLHKVALQTATEVQAFVKGKPRLGFALILQLTGTNGSQQFDKLTKTKTVESILISLDVKGVQTYVTYLLSQVNETDADAGNVSTVNARRAWVIEQLAALVRNNKLPKDDAWLKAVLDWLVIHGLFVIKKKSSKSPFVALHAVPSPIFSDDLRKSCRDKLLLCLGDLSHQVAVITEGEMTKKVAGSASDGEFWISKVLSTIQQLEEDDKHVALLIDADEEETSLRNNARETIGKIKELQGKDHETAKGAELLLLGTLLNHYCASEEEGDHGEAEALQTCIQGASRILLPDGKEKKKKKGKKADEEVEAQEPEPVDLLVDTIIGFLEKSTSYMRTVGNQVFSLLSASVKESTIDLIVTQLERRDPTQLDEDDDEEDEDVEMEDAEEVEDAVSDSDSESEKSGADEDDDPSDQEEADLELRSKIEEALRVNGIEPATGDTDSEEEELMDDDQMMAIDEQLAQVFRTRANEKKSGKNVDAQREATHFKNRVLDLLDIYFRRQPSNPLVLRFITPLIDLIIGSGQDERQLADKARGVLRSRLSKMKENLVDVDVEQTLAIASVIHAHARKARSSENLAILSLCSVYVARTLIHLKKEAPVVELYRLDLVDFATRKNSALNGSFFQDFIQRFPAQAWDLRLDLLNMVEKAINAYRQTQVIQLLDLLLNRLPSFSPSPDEVKEFMPSLKQLLLKVAEESCKESGKLGTAQLKELLKLALLGVRQTTRINADITKSIWQPEAWKSLHQQIKASPRFKSAPVPLKLCERIARTSETSKPEASGKGVKMTAKRKAEQVDGDDEGPTKTKSHKHKKVKAVK